MLLPLLVALAPCLLILRLLTSGSVPSSANSMDACVCLCLCRLRLARSSYSQQPSGMKHAA
eukprot:scaffold289051_cov15-Tisochrysis_lutea.AAC.2